MIYAFTSCALNYAPKARILADSLRLHAPGVRVCLALADRVNDFREELLATFDELFAIEELNEINRPDWIFRHTIVELATAIKPFVLRRLLEREDCEAVVYFDPDIALFQSIEPILDQLKECNLLLTPHLTDPETSIRGIEDNELCALKHGIYNLGFVGVRNTEEGRRFADWWAERLEHYCRSDIPAGIFTDQRWVELAPCFFDAVRISRCPGYNVAPWNMTNRHVSKGAGGRYLVNGEPLIFYHFTGFDSGAHQDMLSVYSTKSPAAVELFRWYTDELKKVSKDPLSATPWAFMTFESGAKISPLQRTVYRERIDLQRAFPDPFAKGGNNRMTFEEWWRVTGGVEYEKATHLPGVTSVIAQVAASDAQSSRRTRSVVAIAWSLVSSRSYRKRLGISLNNTYELWGLAGLLSLVTRKMSRKRRMN